MKTLLQNSVFLLIMLMTNLALAAEQTALQITDPWIREAPPNAAAWAAYMIIDNPTAQPRILTGVICPAFDKVEIHQTMEHKGMMHMMPVLQLPIAPKSQVVLKPGDYHLMLLTRKQPLKAGDQVELTLQFADGEKITITAPVRGISSSDMGHNSSHH